MLMQAKTTKAFLQLLKLSIGIAPVESFEPLTPEEWDAVFKIASKQALIGVTSLGILKLDGEAKPPRALRFNWLYTSERITKLNRQINESGIKIEQSFKEAGFNSCVLKGQGVAQLYPSPGLRQAGDIDLWLCGDRKNIIDFVTAKCQTTHAIYHHMDGLHIDGIEVEVHFTPSYMTSPFANRRLQKWFKSVAPQQFLHTIETEYGQVHVPDLKFNRIFILLHIFRHFLDEGIGLRQMMDWYYVLLKGFTPEERKEAIATYKKLNLLKFVRAATYVLCELFDLPKECQLVEPNENDGKILLDEILSGGNFGKSHQKGEGFRKNILYRGLKRIERSFGFVMMCPQEVIWMPYFKIMNRLFYIRDYRSNTDLK